MSSPNTLTWFWIRHKKAGLVPGVGGASLVGRF